MILTYTSDIYPLYYTFSPDNLLCILQTILRIKYQYLPKIKKIGIESRSNSYLSKLCGIRQLLAVPVVQKLQVRAWPGGPGTAAWRSAGPIWHSAWARNPRPRHRTAPPRG